MARINKSELTKLEIIQAASRHFLTNGYSNTPVKTICQDLDMSTGNLTFYFPTKEHLLGTLVDIFCDFQWKLMEEEAQEGVSSIMAVCLEFVALAVMCEEDAVAKDFFLSAYTSPISLESIRKNDVTRAKEVFKEYRADWSDVQFAEAEILVSGIEYGTLMTAGAEVPLEIRIAGALDAILALYGVPTELRETKIRKALSMDYRAVGRRALKALREYVEQVNEQAFLDLLKV